MKKPTKPVVAAIKPSANYAPNLPKIFSHIRPDGLVYRSIPSLMGNTRKLPSGEVLE